MGYYDICFLVLSILIGLAVGSFLNVVIYRLPNNMSLIKPNSHCPKCNTELKWYDNIPLFSYLSLKGKCRYCGTKISPRYLIVELLNMILWTVTYLIFYKDSYLYAFNIMLIISILIIISYIDFDTMMIMDRFQIILFILAIALIFTDPNFKSNYKDKLLGLLIFGGLFTLLYFFGTLVLKKEIIGGGDIKLFYSFGLILGVYKSILGIFFASITASIVYLIIKNIKNYDKNKEYPFGPFIALGLILALLFGDKIIDLYLGLFNL